MKILNSVSIICALSTSIMYVLSTACSLIHALLLSVCTVRGNERRSARSIRTVKSGMKDNCRGMLL